MSTADDPTRIVIPTRPDGGWQHDRSLEGWAEECRAWGFTHRTAQDREAIQRPEWRDRQ